MFKNNREKSFLSFAIALVVFVAIVVGLGVWPKSTVTNNNSGELKNSIVEYYERMPDHIYKIPEAELKQFVDSNNSDIYILDIRATKDFEEGHIPGAYNIPFKNIGENLDKLPKDKTIIVYCYSGQTGGQTVAALNIYGLKARSLNGGMNNGWLKAGYSTVVE